ncbi:MAG: zinc metallopeptidase [Candidatus Tyloplasma litorale]|nr:MAG: zinc metallopeptidase [Mycoplasmatales bacterium]
MINTLIQPMAVANKAANYGDSEGLVWALWILFFAIIAISVVTVTIHKKFNEKNQKYSLKQSSSQKTGQQIAREILQKNGIQNVKVILGKEGQDHFNPQSGVISLSPSVYNSSSISAMAIAAHEVGHAIQWHKKSVMLRVRGALTKPVQIATAFGQAIFSLGLFFMIFFFSTWLLWTAIAGIVMYAAMGIFQLVTLPVEFDASRRAKKNLKEMGIVSTPEEKEGVKVVLNAAAMTYVIAFLSSMISLAFFIIRFLLLTRRN